MPCLNNAFRFEDPWYCCVDELLLVIVGVTGGAVTIACQDSSDYTHQRIAQANEQL